MTRSPEERIAKYILRNQQGIFTDKEAVASLVLELTRVSNPSDIHSLFQSIPNELQISALGFLQQLRDSDFRWRPLRIGEPYSDVELEELSVRLKLLYDTLPQNQ